MADTKVDETATTDPKDDADKSESLSKRPNKRSKTDSTGNTQAIDDKKKPQKKGKAASEPVITVSTIPKEIAAAVFPVDFKGEKIPITGEPGCNLTAVANSTPFVDWLKNFDNKELTLKSIHVQSVDNFGPRVGFIKFVATVEKDGKSIPGITFMRGGAVAILPILHLKKEDYVLTTVQGRVPIGRLFMEIPAGMIDDNGDFKGQAAKEMEEETGLKIKTDKLKDLTELAYGSEYKGMIPSAGGCDEFIRLYLYEEKITEAKFKELEGKCTGVLEHGEIIKLKLVKYGDLWHSTSDAKALSALLLYERLKAAGKL